VSEVELVACGCTALRSRDHRDALSIICCLPITNACHAVGAQQSQAKTCSGCEPAEVQIVAKTMCG
jgi:hypothetical protein